jgi:hypothetical protein
MHGVVMWIITVDGDAEIYSDRSEFLREVNRLICKRIEFSVSYS